MKNKNDLSNKNVFFNSKKTSKAVQDMIDTANDLKNVGTDVNSVEVNNNWDGNLYTYSFNRVNR